MWAKIGRFPFALKGKITPEGTGRRYSIASAITRFLSRNHSWHEGILVYPK
jgi:hypothetical protein